ncbi:hypothetical protein J437_LFUL015629 [Ladona fulva]|uniref:Complex I-15 kDa n=1 Tax=Ladona fulva TaxID=123851 RepID=A0A8K0KJD0_LADFU|nr:hypothetical protein J437_LFUL015629 [Ladona fulva]
MVECLEAYGIKRAKVKCDDLLQDFRECTTQKKQFDRIAAMRIERHKQYLKNERKEHYAEAPKADS